VLLRLEPRIDRDSRFHSANKCDRNVYGSIMAQGTQPLKQLAEPLPGSLQGQFEQTA
jgi:hypothetical protein